MKALVTGAAGFIGWAVSSALLKRGYEVTGVDNINDYYDPALKLDRLRMLGIDVDKIEYGKRIRSLVESGFSFVKLDLENSEGMAKLFAEEKADVVVSFGGQAGVRYSLVNPRAFVESNVGGFLNVLEGCRTSGVRHLVYASSSSVYGLNAKVPFSEHDAISHPVSLYAATKMSNELMAHSYSHLFGIPATGLRFFTVYGPWGRPDMSPFLFIDAILRGNELKMFNGGEMMRDFTYVDDVAESVCRVVELPPESSREWDPLNPDPATSSAPYRILNVGNQQPVSLQDYIGCIEECAGMAARTRHLPMQPGDIPHTWADSSALESLTGFRPSTPLREGMARTVAWYRDYYHL